MQQPIHALVVEISLIAKVFVLYVLLIHTKQLMRMHAYVMIQRWLGPSSPTHASVQLIHSTAQGNA